MQQELRETDAARVFLCVAMPRQPCSLRNFIHYCQPLQIERKREREREREKKRLLASRFLGDLSDGANGANLGMSCLC